MRHQPGLRVGELWWSLEGAMRNAAADNRNGRHRGLEENPGQAVCLEIDKLRVLGESADLDLAFANLRVARDDWECPSFRKLKSTTFWLKEITWHGSPRYAPTALRL